MTKRLYVSDVHLQPPSLAVAGDKITGVTAPKSNAENTDVDSQRLAAFAGLLRREVKVVDEIYLLGDLCEMWIGDDDDCPLIATLEALFIELASSTSLFFLAGNRDFLLGADFAKRTGLQLLSDPSWLDDGTLLTHGDALCTDDEPYQQMRALLRSPEWQADILSKTLAERRAFGAALRERSKAENSNKAINIMDVNAKAVNTLLSQTNGHSPQVFIHGHTHRPGIHSTPLETTAGEPVERVVLGAWERCGWWAMQDTQAPHIVTLHCAGITQLAAL